ncbi:hypothetical protein ACOMHN_046183 [Nucella lapillus]
MKCNDQLTTSSNVNNSVQRGSQWWGTWQKIRDADRLLHPHWMTFQPLPYAFHFSVGMAVTVTAVASVVGNLLVLCSFVRFRSLRTSSNMYVVSLALADILMGILSLPLFAAASFVGYWPFGYYGCQFYGLMTGTTGLVTINTLAAISYDRQMAVVHHLSPRRHDSKALNLMVILVIWTVSGLWVSAPFVGWGSYILEGIGTTCTFDYLSRDPKNLSFVLLLMVFNFAIPMVLIVFFYSKIFMAVTSVQRELVECLSNITVDTQRQLFRRKSELKTARAIVVIICFFCIAWTPYVIVSLMGLVGDVSLVTPLVSALPCLLAKVATVSNLPLYSIGHPKFRREMCRLLRRTSLRGTLYRRAGVSILNVTPDNNNPLPESDV